MLTVVLILTIINTALQVFAAYQRHVAIQHQKRNGNGGGG